MKILITGSSGTLGKDVIDKLIKTKHSVFPETHQSMDIRDVNSIHHQFQLIKPDLVIHLAALTNVDYCELHKNETYEVNMQGTKNILRECSILNIPLFFLSTGAVFSGSKHTAYSEYDHRNAINIYGKSKLEAENIIKKYKNHCIIRTGWLIGGGKHDKKFISFILKQLQEGKKELKAVADVHGSPTLTDDLAKMILTLIKKSARGTFHIVNSGVASRLDITNEVLKILKEKDIKVTPVKLGYFNEKAKRPKMEALKSIRLKRMGIKELPSWQQSLKKYLLSLS